MTMATNQTWSQANGTTAPNGGQVWGLLASPGSGDSQCSVGNSLTHSHSLTLTHPLTHSLTLTYRQHWKHAAWETHSLTLTHPLTHSLTHSHSHIDSTGSMQPGKLTHSLTLTHPLTQHCTFEHVNDSGNACKGADLQHIALVIDAFRGAMSSKFLSLSSLACVLPVLASMGAPTLQGCLGQTALGRQDLPCTHLA